MIVNNNIDNDNNRKCVNTKIAITLNTPMICADINI